MGDNPKINVGPPSEFSFFPGFTYLFNNPNLSTSDSVTPELLACALSENGNALYRKLGEFTSASATIKTFIDQYGFCPLPDTTYHVTACDLVNESNVDRLSPQLTFELRKYWSWLRRVPPNGSGSLVPEVPVSVRSAIPPLKIDRRWPEACFRFDRFTLSYEGGAALIAILQPADNDSTDFFGWLREERRSIQRQLGLAGSPGRDAHVSIGYFLESAQARKIESSLSDLTQSFASEPPSPISFSTISLYTFRDMITFWRLYEP